MRKNEPTKEHRQHWQRCADIGCILTTAPAQIAHCHSGSTWELGAGYQPGMAERQNHWLVLPLAPKLHLELDAGVDAWELRYYTQLHLLERLSHYLNVNVFEKAGVNGYHYSYFSRPCATEPKSSAQNALGQKKSVQP